MNKNKDYGFVVSGVGVAINILLFAVKLSAGRFSNSTAIVADAWNNLADAATFLVTLFAFRVSRRKQNHYYPFGYGRAEYVAGLFVGFTILLVGLELIANSVSKIRTPEKLYFHFSTVIILLVSVVMKLLLGFYSGFSAKQASSPSLKALAIDSFSDAGITLITLFSYLSSHYLGWQVDGYMGLVAALLILLTGLSFTRETVRFLLGYRGNMELTKDIEHLLLSYDEILSAHDIMVHQYGNNTFYSSAQVTVCREQTAESLSRLFASIQLQVEEQFHMDIHLQPATACSDSKLSL